MTTESQQQVAREAEQLARVFHNIYEKLAPDFGYETRTETRDFNPETPNGKLMVAVCSEILQWHLPAQPQRSEQEWTEEKVFSYLLGHRTHVKSLTRDINAALTAEREKLSEFYIAARMEDKRQLTAERQLREQATERYCLSVDEHADTKMQLLSALAAIEKHNHEYDDAKDRCVMHIWKPIDVDLSLLHEHDAEIIADREAHFLKREAEVRKPLVDALELAEKDLRLAFNLNKEGYGYSKGLQSVVEALAKVKQ